MKKKIIMGGVFLLALLFVLMPLPASDLIIRVYFDDIAGDFCSLYYSTDENKSFSAEQCILSEIDYTQNSVEFRLDGALEKELTALRLDWPQSVEQLICVKDISISSGGVIQKQYNPCCFFADENIAFAHETSVTTVLPRNRAYLLIGADDPYQILSDISVEEIKSCYSHRIISRICLCLFIVGCFFFAGKKLFT